MTDRGTPELARELERMVSEPGVQEQIDRVVSALGAFCRDASGQIVRRPPADQTVRPARTRGRMKNKATLIALARYVHFARVPERHLLNRLQRLDWVRGLLTTKKGHQALHDAVIEAEAESGRHLGNFNELKDQTTTRADRTIRLSEEALELANVLRGNE